ncbi:aminoglycoside phosphotransferase family protein [Paenibacillus sp. 598K]|uniref:aminoglycoside phosphotransferase family protein n=1 Tax=Paenibacillus sp. 598K TaxID=1117987 RepID=UPI000FFF22FC|nr:aminoglycoside phosphotransferase family protein [Paenibacillus sp. 598K]
MIDITIELVHQLVRTQFPDWANLEITAVEKNGHDNRTYRLGNERAVRLPSHERYAAAIDKEMLWLPVFKPLLSLPISVPLAKGEPTDEYPLPWSINRWIDGETLRHDNILNLQGFAKDLASFLKELQSIDASRGIPAGIQNFHRGGNLAVYNDEARMSIQALSGHYDQALLTEIWNSSLESKFQSTPVWLHGDIAVGNLIVKDGKLCGVIDFGTMGVGDPSSDLVMAWNFFDQSSRQLFLKLMDVDQDTVNRARGWALWKALITCVQQDKDSEASSWGNHVIQTILQDYKQS